ncbi:MAG: YihY/virulence factor BrkB family protein [Hyphomicrobium sp.]
MELKERIIARLWEEPPRSVPSWKRGVISALRVMYVTVRDIQEGQLTLQAMSLVYTTLLSLVPLIAISFSVLAGFGVQHELEPLLIDALEPLGPEKSAEVTERIIQFVDNVSVGVLGGVGLVFLLYTVVTLMQKIEGAFNSIWHVPHERSLARRFSDYLSIILIGPVLVFSALGVTATITATPLIERLAALEPVGTLIAIGTQALPYALVVTAFTFIYVFMPNTKVRVGSALVGGLAAGVLWATAGFMFTWFVADSTNYAAIYSAFATLIVFMIWLYVNWMILLIGGTIAFYHQNPDSVTPYKESARLSNRIKERIALSAALLIGQSYYGQEQAWTLERLARRLRVPRDVLGLVLDALERAGLMKRTVDKPLLYLPGRPPETTPIKAVLDAVRVAEEGHMALTGVTKEPVVERLEAMLDEAVGQALDQRTVKDMVQDRLEGGVTTPRVASGE